MAKDNFTPEEKLLRIIEAGPDKLNMPLPGLKPGSSKAAPSGSKANIFNKDAFKKIKLADIKKAVVALCAVITLVLVIDFIRTATSFNRRLDTLIIGKKEAPKSEAGEPGAGAGITEAPAIEEERNIFSFNPPRSKEAAAAGLEELPSLAHLKLVGIIWSDSPQAMIEDTKGQRTDVVNVGDMVGIFKIKRIAKDSVTVEAEGVEQQLR